MNYLTGKQIELRAVEPEDLDALYRCLLYTSDAADEL